MTDLTNIEQEVVKIVSECLKIDQEKVKLDARFVDDLGADSLDQVELIMELENKFNIDIPDEVAEKIQKVSDAIKHIQDNNKNL
jgi:acyl carrier protein